MGPSNRCLCAGPVGCDFHQRKGTRPGTSLRDSLLQVEFIAKSRKNAQQIDTKFSIIIMLTKTHVGDPTVEERLIAIRRACQLDSRTGFFALAPCDVAELNAFVNTYFSYS